MKKKKLENLLYLVSTLGTRILNFTVISSMLRKMPVHNKGRGREGARREEGRRGRKGYTCICIHLELQTRDNIQWA